MKQIWLNSSWAKTNYSGNNQYYNKRITIFVLRHSSIEELCDTIIHEYVHHLQIRTSNDDIRYNRLTRLKSYWENDYEVEARYIASKYSKKCLNDLKFWEFYWKFFFKDFRFSTYWEIFPENYFILVIVTAFYKVFIPYAGQDTAPPAGLSPTPDPPRDHDLLYTRFPINRVV